MHFIYLFWFLIYVKILKFLHKCLNISLIIIYLRGLFNAFLIRICHWIIKDNLTLFWSNWRVMRIQVRIIKNIKLLIFHIFLFILFLFFYWKAPLIVICLIWAKSNFFWSIYTFLEIILIHNYFFLIYNSNWILI